ncbi:hypothetical protein [Winogradskyella marincola]|uniref:Uncharacterized protein n=1 Tax=Winogradskyella marincola TaxID=3037795 RepID=A0ABT6G4S6_9FLAO|nr:hypothetical protein [Winogradskyella sp. YYF002]MDG4716912.1 hypothetical protein [Winogradskyella sp. YYF002]
MAISNCLFSPTYENPRGFSIQFVFANLVAEKRNEIIHKHDSETLKNISFDLS